MVITHLCLNLHIDLNHSYRGTTDLSCEHEILKRNKSSVRILFVDFTFKCMYINKLDALSTLHIKYHEIAFNDAYNTYLI